MPRQSAVSAAFAVKGSTRAALTPPADLTEPERAEFINIVLGTRPDHFVPSDLPLLSAYARAIVQERIAADRLACKPVVDDKASPWLAIWQGKVRALTTLARMLALSPGGRVPKSPEPEPVNYYAKMALEAKANHDDDDPN